MMFSSDELDLAARVGRLLLARGCRLATAESCTGGLISALLTEIPGSSGWFERGFVTYSNAAKQQMLNVPASLLASVGAVSVEVARAMASGALAASGADLGVAVTGIAGPDGGTPRKPVGTVCIAWAGRHDGQVTARQLQLSGTRAEIRAQATRVALEGLAHWLAAGD